MKIAFSPRNVLLFSIGYCIAIGCVLGFALYQPDVIIAQASPDMPLVDVEVNVLPESAPAEEPTGIPEPLSEKTGKQVWLEIQPIFELHQQRRVAVLNERMSKLGLALAEMNQSIKTEGFAKELMKIGTMGQAFGSDYEAKQFLKANFSKYVVNVDQLETAICAWVDELHQHFMQLDNELLIACGLDVEFDPSLVQLLRPNLDGIHRQFEATLPQINSMMEEAFVANLLSIGAGLIAGDVASDIGYELGRNSNGEATMFSYLLSGALGIAAGAAAEEATSQVMQTQDSIRSDAQGIASKLMAGVMTNPSHYTSWELAMKGLSAKHEDACIQTIADTLGVEGDWMRETLKAGQDNE